MKPREKSRIYFVDGSCLSSSSKWEDLFDSIRESLAFGTKEEDNSTLEMGTVPDILDRPYFINWNNVTYVEDRWCKYDQLMEHKKENSELGKLADYISDLYGFPETNQIFAVTEWLRENQDKWSREDQKLFVMFSKDVVDFWVKDNPTLTFEATKWDEDQISIELKEIERKAAEIIGQEQKE